MESAINAFKTQKANQANAQNKELTDTQASLQKVQLENQRLKIEKKAYDFVDDLNVDNKTMPYLLKMADFNNCIGKDGNVLEDTLKAALQKVVDDVPGLKKQVQGVVGITVGADTNNGTNSNNGVFDFGFTGVRPEKNKKNGGNHHGIEKTGLNYAKEYSQTLAQAYPYTLFFGALWSAVKPDVKFLKETIQ